MAQQSAAAGICQELLGPRKDAIKVQQNGGQKHPGNHETENEHRLGDDPRPVIAPHVSHQREDAQNVKLGCRTIAGPFPKDQGAYHEEADFEQEPEDGRRHIFKGHGAYFAPANTNSSFVRPSGAPLECQSHIIFAFPAHCVQGLRLSFGQVLDLWKSSIAQRSSCLQQLRPGFHRPATYPNNRIAFLWIQGSVARCVQADTVEAANGWIKGGSNAQVGNGMDVQESCK